MNLAEGVVVLMMGVLMGAVVLVVVFCLFRRCSVQRARVVDLLEQSTTFLSAVGAASSDLSSVAVRSSSVSHPSTSFLSFSAGDFELRPSEPSLRSSPRRIKKPRQNPNLLSHYGWVRDILELIVSGDGRQKVTDMNSKEHGTPLFVVAGGCPNKMTASPMQVLIYCQMEQDIDFWWVKPQVTDPRVLEARTLNKHFSGAHKNAAERSQKLFRPFAERFLGMSDGEFYFNVDPNGRAYIEENSAGKLKARMLVYFVWQESFSSSPWKRRVEGKICYEKQFFIPEELGGSVFKHQGERKLFSRQYRIQDNRMWIASASDEEEVHSLVPPDSFQEMYDVDTQVSTSEMSTSSTLGTT